MLFVLVKMVRSQDARKYRHVRFQLHPHEGVHNALCDEFVAIDTAVNYEGGSGDARVLSGRCKPSDE